MLMRNLIANYLGQGWRAIMELAFSISLGTSTEFGNSTRKCAPKIA